MHVRSLDIGHALVLQQSFTHMLQSVAWTHVYLLIFLESLGELKNKSC
jgi:hypothetical protein